MTADIIFWAHDRFGVMHNPACWRKSRLIKPSDKLFPFTQDAVRYNSKLIAYPIAVKPCL